LKEQVEAGWPRSTPARSTRSSCRDRIVVRVGRYGPYLERGEERQDPAA
jgi:topoisomerase IA-like protein